MVRLFLKTRPHVVSAKVFVSCRVLSLRSDERSPRGFYVHTFLRYLYLSNGKRYLHKILNMSYLYIRPLTDNYSK